MGALTIVTAATGLPVSVDEMKIHSRIKSNEDDAYVEGLIEAATYHVQEICGRQLRLATLRWSLDAFASLIELPRSPVVSVSSITYVDSDGATQTLAASVYRVDTYNEPSRITLAADQSWPAISSVTNAVNIQFIAGYGGASGTAADVPAGLKTVIKLIAASAFEQRESITEAKIMQNWLFDNLLAPHRVWEVGGV